MSTESLKFPSGRSVGNCRKDAKRLRKQEKISLHDALDRVAIDNGGELSWSISLEKLPKALSDSHSPELLITLTDVKNVMKEFPTLNYYGFTVGRYSDKSYSETLELNRNALLDALDECNRVANFLKFVQPRKSINKRVGSSYGLKHEVERFCRSFPDVRQSDQYVANGSFICAALHLGFNFQPVEYGSPNLYFNMSSRSSIFEWSKLKRSAGSMYYRPNEVARLKELEDELGLSN